jgi:uncharacterized protein with von Willebrand factor type A (vWA) domain
MNHYTEIVVIIDKSGSMEPFVKDTIGGYNAFIADQKQIPGQAKLTTVLFNTVYEVFENSSDLQNAIPLTQLSYVPGGNTALLYAMHKTITDVKNRIEALPEADRTNKILVMTITDGQENASYNVTKEQIKELVTELTAKGWRFEFMSADMSAIDEAIRSYGYTVHNTMAFAQTSDGYKRGYSAMNIHTTSLRTDDKT